MGLILESERSVHAPLTLAKATRLGILLAAAAYVALAGCWVRTSVFCPTTPSPIIFCPTDGLSFGAVSNNATGKGETIARFHGRH